MEVDLVKRAGIPYRAIPAAGVHGVGLRALPRNIWELSRGVLASRRVLAEFRPDVLFFTGGYVAVPVGLAARTRLRASERSGILLYVPDIEPGLALKALARFADHVAVTVEKTASYLPARAPRTVTGYPVRGELRQWERPDARQALDLQADLPVLLVFGGSKGARSINRALLADLEALLAEMQIVHISGQLDWPEVKARQTQLSEELPGEISSRYHVFPYLHERMGAALATADLVVSRAGASALGEYPQFGLPAILAPYPFAWRYQQVNANYLAERKAAVILPDERLASELAPMVKELMGNPGQREAMRRAMHSLARSQAAESIAKILENLVSESRSGRN